MPLWSLRGVAAGAVLLFAHVSDARTCCADADCPRGFSCSAGSGGGTGVCGSALSCQSNADCAAGTRCYLNFGTQCTPAPDGGQSCGPGSACAPEWQVPCAVSADCGPGFTCSAQTCVRQQTPTCTVDADCPSTWTCRCVTACSAAGLPEPDGGPDAGACTSKGCMPPNSDLGLGTFQGATCGPPVDAGCPAPDAGADAGAAKPVEDAESPNVPDGGGGATATPSDAGSAAPDAGGGGGGGGSSGGCSVGPAGGALAGLGVLALGLVGLARRRRTLGGRSR